MTVDQRLKTAIRWGHMRAAARLLTTAYQMITDAVDEVYVTNDPLRTKLLTHLMIDATDLAQDITRESKKLQHSLDEGKEDK
jgi:hypothetical protein